MKDKLIELMLNAPKKKITIGGRESGKTYQTVENIVDHLLRNGVIVSPCNIGDTVYTLGHGNSKQPKKWVVTGVWFSQDASCNYLHLYWYKDKDNFESRQASFSEIGKTVFLTEEEATLRKEKMRAENKEAKT